MEMTAAWGDVSPVPIHASPGKLNGGGTLTTWRDVLYSAMWFSAFVAALLRLRAVRVTAVLADVWFLAFPRRRLMQPGFALFSATTALYDDGMKAGR
jgi:hypothetical protein